MQKWLTVKYNSELEKSEIGLPDNTYTVSLVLGMLVSALTSIVQICTEKEFKLKDYQMMNRIKKNLDNGVEINSTKDLTIILKADMEEEWINISFPSEQGFLPIEQTADLICLALYTIIKMDKDPVELRTLVNNGLNASFIKPDLSPIEITDEFLKK